MILFITYTLYYILYYILYIRLLNIAVYRRMAIADYAMTILFLFRGGGFNFQWYKSYNEKKEKERSFLWLMLTGQRLKQNM